MSGLIPAIALAIQREQLEADRATDRDRLAAEHAAQLDEMRREHRAKLDAVRDRERIATARAEAAQAQVVAAAREATQAHEAAKAVRLRLAEQLRIEARTTSRAWAGAFRYIANQLEGAAA